MFARMSTRRSQARGAARVLHDQPMQVASEELRNLIASVEDLVERLGTAADPELKGLRKRAEGALARARTAIARGGTQLGEQAGDLAERGQEYVRRGHGYVRRRPVTSIGLVALGLLAVGVWASRSMMDD
jgi:ElaB/YqjD/DUF883 family membrane-anchored ribosome-binding protein